MGATNTWWKPGGYNVICDRTGFKLKNSQVRREWTGQTVRRQSWEERHPQDLIRSVQDHQAVDDPNPEGANDFVGVNEVIDVYEDDRDSATATATPAGGNTGDGTVTSLTADLSADTSGNYTLSVLTTTLAAASSQDPGRPAEFRLTFPGGAIIGEGEVGTAFTGGGLAFALKEDGLTNFIIGDSFTIAVTVA